MKKASNKFKTKGAKSYDFSQDVNARANLLKEQRLSQKQNQLNQIAKATERAEAKLPRTDQALTQLGAGSAFGS